MSKRDDRAFVEATTEQLLTTAEAAVKASVQVEVREFVAA